jgi:hypothetical protein
MLATEFIVISRDELLVQAKEFDLSEANVQHLPVRLDHQRGLPGVQPGGPGGPEGRQCTAQGLPAGNPLLQRPRLLHPGQP